MSENIPETWHKWVPKMHSLLSKQSNPLPLNPTNIEMTIADNEIYWKRKTDRNIEI